MVVGFFCFDDIAGSGCSLDLRGPVARGAGMFLVLRSTPMTDPFVVADIVAKGSSGVRIESMVESVDGRSSSNLV